VQKIGLRGRALAEERNVLSTNHLTHLSAQFLVEVGRIQLWTRRLGRVEERSLCTKSHIFSATKVLAAGFDPVRASTSPGRCRPVDWGLLAGRLLCQPSPNRAPNERNLYPCVATIALV
jgi:hypothetical protein